ncbi:helix-turn-helix domain-containing protein [Pararhizobium sp. A13]|uniref:helix-turn-helix domain-containing protein n=1 Tax=Pararhizobium sp. A13 TaxID=3133975 RepID=UPI00324856EB
MTQVEKILNHIQKNGSITQREAYLDYGIQSFHRRLSDIREMGVRLLPVQKVHPTTGQEYTRYFIAGSKANGKPVKAA